MSAKKGRSDAGREFIFLFPFHPPPLFPQSSIIRRGWTSLYTHGKCKIRSTWGRFCEPERLSNPHKPLFSLKPLDTKPPLGRCYMTTTCIHPLVEYLLCAVAIFDMISKQREIGSSKRLTSNAPILSHFFLRIERKLLLAYPFRMTAPVGYLTVALRLLLMLSKA